MRHALLLGGAEVAATHLGLEDGQELPRPPSDVTARAEPLVLHGDLPGDLGENRPDDSREGHVDHVWVLAEDEGITRWERSLCPRILR